MKRFLYFIGLLVLLLPNVLFAAGFSDVGDEHPNFRAIEFLKQFDVVNGYSDGTFRPDNKVNRAEALKMVLLAGGVDINSVLAEEILPEDTKIVFDDVPDEAWFAEIVEAALRKKIVNGYDDGTFKPDKPVILAEALKMAFQAFDMTGLPTEFSDPYHDVSKDLWFAPFAGFSASKNITLAQEDGLLHGEKEISRAELAELLYRFRYVANHNLEAVPFSWQWQTYKSTDLGIQTLLPPKWEVTNNPRSVLFWKKDPAFTNVHHELLFPNSASISFSKYENKENFSKEDFFEQLKLSSTYAYDKVETIEIQIAGFDVLKIDKSGSNNSTYIFEMKDGSFLVAFTNYGNGYYADYLKKAIDEVLKNITSVSGEPLSVEQVKSRIFAKLLIEGAADELLDLIGDEILIEADALGIGSGPVDYYYSEDIDLTLKIERKGKTLLDTREGKTSAF